MKKLFTIAAAFLFVGNTMAATYKTYALSDLTKSGTTYEVTGLSSNDQKLNKGERVVEVPSAEAEGTLFLSGTGANADRYASIYKTNGTVYDAERQIAMTSGYNEKGIAFSASDILTKDGKYYIVFGSSYDYKINAFKYTLIDPTKATVKSISVNGVALAEFAADKLSYDVELAYGTVDIPEVTAVAGDGASIVITQATTVDGSATVVCTSKDGTSETKTYTLNFSVATSQSTDATLKSLKVDGKDMPGFKADSLEYEWTVAYTSTSIPEVTVEVNDPTANAVVTPATAITKAKTDEGTTVIVVTAQDGTTKLTYKVAFIRADALKSLVQVKFSNGFDAFIDNTNHTVKAYYLAGTDAPTITTLTKGEGKSAALNGAGDAIVVVGDDDTEFEYALTIEAVTPNTDVVEETASAGVFAGTEAWVKNGLTVFGNSDGFTSNKYILRRQLKSGDAANDQRVIAGWVRAYFFVGNASKFELTQSSNKGVKYTIDGGTPVEVSSDASTISIALEEGNHMIEIVTNQSKGNCELSAPKLVKRVPTAIDNAAVSGKAVKVIENGQMIIIKNGVKYDLTGSVIR